MCLSMVIGKVVASSRHRCWPNLAIVLPVYRPPLAVRCVANQPYIASTGLDKQKISAPKAGPVVAAPKNMSLRYCTPSPAIAMGTDSCDTGTAKQSATTLTTGRPLTVIMSWMLASDRHLEVYRHMWFRRGFDVLTVKTTPLDLLLPPVGAQVVAKNLIHYLSRVTPKYDEIVIHAFSVGGYQYGEVMRLLKADPDRHRALSRSLKGIIIDSMVHVEAAAPGLSRAITTNPVIQPLLQASINVYLTLTRNISAANYRKSSDQIFENPFRLPGLLLYSSDDIVSEMKSNDRLSQKWQNSGIPVRSKCWNHSNHVLHYRNHQYEYEQHLDNYLSQLHLKSQNI